MTRIRNPFMVGAAVLAFVFLVSVLAEGVTAESAIANAASDIHNSEANKNDETKLPVYAQLTLAVILIALSAVFAGLTIGIMGLDTLSLEIIAASGAEPDKSYAQTLLPVRKKGHQALCTLVLGNMWANVMIAQFCADVNPEGGGSEEGGEGGGGGGGAAIISFLLSTLLILIFAEILPMSICKSSKALMIASKGVTILNVFMVILAPVAWPLGKLLDKIIKHDIGQIYDRNELKRLMVLHCETHGDKSGLMKSELDLLIGAMEFHETVIGDIMTPLNEVFMLQDTDVVDQALMQKLWRKGHSRVPVYEAGQRERIIGILFVKDLILPSTIMGKTARQLVDETSHAVFTVSCNVKLPAMLKNFQQGKAHLVIVQREEDEAERQRQQQQQHSQQLTSNSSFHEIENASSPHNPHPILHSIGVVTLEDVIEKLIRQEIYDEYDDEDEEYHNMMLANNMDHQAGGAGTVKKRPPVNFYSYYVRPEGEPRVDLTPEQWMSAAYFLVNTCEVFVHLKPRHLAKLLKECGDLELRPTKSLHSPKKKDAASSPHKKVHHHPSSAQFLEDCDESLMLYRAGVKSNCFTLILSGGVDVLVDGFVGEKRTFSVLGEAALTNPDWVPTFSAKVVTPTRIVRISREQFEAAFDEHDTLHNGSMGGSLHGASSPGGAHLPRTVSGNSTPFSTPQMPLDHRHITEAVTEADPPLRREDTRHHDDEHEMLRVSQIRENEDKSGGVQTVEY